MTNLRFAKNLANATWQLIPRYQKSPLVPLPQKAKVAKITSIMTILTIPLVPLKSLWSPQNVFGPPTMVTYHYSCKFSLRWSWQLTKQLKDMLYLILKCDLFWWFKFDWVCFGLLGCVWVVLVEVWKVNSGGWVRGGSRCKRRALASHYRQRRTLANSFSQTKV